MWIILLEMKTPRCLYLCNNQVITPCIVLQMVISDYMRDNSTIRCFLANFVKLRNMCWLLISMTSLQHLANLHAKSITNNKQISWHNPVMRHNQGRQEKSGVVDSIQWRWLEMTDSSEIAAFSRIKNCLLRKL